MGVRTSELGGLTVGELLDVLANVETDEGRDLVGAEIADRLTRLKSEKDEAQLQEHLAKNAEVHLRRAGEGLALMTRRRLRGDATTSEALRLALCAWDEVAE